MELQPPQFFNRGPGLVVRFTVYGFLSVFLMVLDARFRYAEPLRTALSIATYPMQQAALAPVAAVGRMTDYFTTQAELRRENENLRNEQLRNAQDLLTLANLRSDNEHLRSLLGAREKIPGGAVLAEIVYAGRDPFSRKVIIDKGSTQGLELGQAVIDARGILGQVTRVHPLLAEVTLLTEKDHSIPVQVVRNGLRGVAYGSGDGSTLDLRHLATNAEVQVGDVLVTSGIDTVYPPGLPVAHVVNVERTAGSAFARILCVPAAGIDKYRQVLVLAKTEDASLPAESEPPKQRGRAKRPRRAS
jgi:rod shape-determining protein MreC